MRRQDIVLSVISGILLALSFPPLKMGFLAYVGLVPFLYALRQKDYRDGAYLGFVMGLAFHGAAFYWIFIITVIGGMITVLVYALHIALFALLLRLFIRDSSDEPVGIQRVRSKDIGIWAAPLIWTAMEYLRTFGALGFPWATLAYSQTEYLPLIQYASITSVYGVSGWIVVVNVVFYKGFLHFQRKKSLEVSWCMVAVLLFAIPYGYGRWAMHRCDRGQASAQYIKIAVIQPNIGPREKWHDRKLSLRVLPKLAIQAAAYSPDLIIWPETALPYYLLKEPSLARQMHILSDSLGIPILTGALDYSFKDDETYNAAFLFLPDVRQVQTYCKMHLVPMSERVPFRTLFPFLKDLTMGRAGEFAPGKERTIFHHPLSRFATLICYESIFPYIARTFVKKGAEFLVIITNDAWFGPWSSASQHAHISVFRAIEHRISIARSANTGISMFVDPCGRMLKSLELSVRGITIKEVRLRQGYTFFSQYGNVFSQICVGVVLIMLVWIAVEHIAQRRLDE